MSNAKTIWLSNMNSPKSRWASSLQSFSWYITFAALQHHLGGLLHKNYQDSRGQAKQMGHTSWDFGARVRWLRASRRLPMLSQSTKAVSLASQRIFFISPLREHWSFSSASQRSDQRNCKQKILCEQPASDAKCKHLTPAANYSCKWFAVHVNSSASLQSARLGRRGPEQPNSCTAQDGNMLGSCRIPVSIHVLSSQLLNARVESWIYKATLGGNWAQSKLQQQDRCH